MSGARQAEGPFLKPQCLGGEDLLDTVDLSQGAAVSHQWPPTHQGV